MGAEALYHQGLINKNKDEHDLALSDFNKALELNPMDAKTYYSRGNIYREKGDYDLAISDYSKALEIDPNYASAYNNRELPMKVKASLTSLSRILIRRWRLIPNLLQLILIEVSSLMTKDNTILHYLTIIKH